MDIPRRGIYGALPAYVLVACLSACGGGGGTSLDNVGTVSGVLPEDGAAPIIDTSDPDQCNAATQKQWVYESMLDQYLFYSQVPNVDPQAYASPEDLLNVVKFQERDNVTSLSDTAVSSTLLQQGREFGLGFTWGLDSNGIPRLASVVEDSPFGRLGLQRGDRVISVDGIDWLDEALSAGYQQRVIGTPAAPATARWRFSKRGTGLDVEYSITAAEYSINTIMHSAYLSQSNYDGLIAYLVFDRFLDTSRAELVGLFSQFSQGLSERNVTEMVLDLRYNEGGLIAIAELLASLIAGDARAGATLMDYRHNDKYGDRNFALKLLPDVGDLGLSRIFILTSQRTSAASEIVIDGLRPHMQVITIGSRTGGKPFLQEPEDRCAQRLSPVVAEGFNAAGNSAAGGLTATCFADDDLTRDFGIDTVGRAEGMLFSALRYIAEGPVACEPAPASSRALNDFVTANSVMVRTGRARVAGSFLTDAH